MVETAAKQSRRPPARKRLRRLAGRLLRRVGPKEFPRRALLPSLGFFGGIDADRWEVRIAATVRAIRISLPASSPRPLSLRGVELVRDGRVLTVPVNDRRVHFSSYPHPQTDPGRWLRLQVTSTTSERRPWWLLELVRPIRVDALRIYNRREAHGAHNRGLRVQVKDVQGHWRTVATASSQWEFEQSLALASELGATQVGTTPAPTRLVHRRHRRAVAAVLRTLVSDDPPTLDRAQVRRLLALIPSRATPRHPRLSPDEWRLLVELLLQQLRASPGTATSIASFAEMLPDRASLDRLTRDLCARAPHHGLPELLITRHGIRPAGSLRQHSTQYLELIGRMAELFEEWGHPLMLGYGTLLGAVREGDFLIHDDDIDLLFELPDGSPQEVASRLRAIHRAVAERGWKVSNDSTMPMNFHVTDPSGGLHVDIFPVLVGPDEARLHMEQMQVRGIRREIVSPPTTLAFLGRHVPVPADSEGFLQERYGDGWRVSDPYYDWPWPLAKETN